jgi:hypothetical protein
MKWKFAGFGPEVTEKGSTYMSSVQDLWNQCERLAELGERVLNHNAQILTILMELMEASQVKYFSSGSIERDLRVELDKCRAGEPAVKGTLIAYADLNSIHSRLDKIETGMDKQVDSNTRYAERITQLEEK